MTKAPTEDECEPNSVFVPHHIEGRLGTCWRYMVLESVCLLVQFTKKEENNSYVWRYLGGCYEDGVVEKYVPGIPGEDYSFTSLAIEVREVKFGAEIFDNGESEATVSGSLSILLWRVAMIFFIASIALGCFIGYKESEKKKISE